MDYLPTALVITLPAVQGIGELWAMRRTHTLHRWRCPEWTFFAVNGPYWLLVVAAAAECHVRGIVPSAVTLLVGVGLVAAGIGLRVAGHLQLGGAFSPYVDVARHQRLVTAGLYRRIRHPMYLGTTLILLGVPVMAAGGWSWLLAGAAGVGLLVRMAKEEDLLYRRLAGYAAYQARTWRMLPGLW